MIAQLTSAVCFQMNSTVCCQVGHYFMSEQKCLQLFTECFPLNVSHSQIRRVAGKLFHDTQLIVLFGCG